MASLKKVMDAINKIVVSDIVSCPSEPVAIPGIGAGAEGANDAMGTYTKVKVPKKGIIYGATFFDLDDEGSQVDLEIFKRSYTAVSDNAEWDLSVADAVNFVHEISFFAFDDHKTTQTSEDDSPKAYTAKEGYFYIQAVCRGTPTIATAPKFQLQILSFDPEFTEG